MKNLINIIDLIRSQEWDGLSEEMEIAKGKYAYPDRWADVKRKFKRGYRMLKLKYFG